MAFPPTAACRPRITPRGVYVRECRADRSSNPTSRLEPGTAVTVTPQSRLSESRYDSGQRERRSTSEDQWTCSLRAGAQSSRVAASASARPSPWSSLRKAWMSLSAPARRPPLRRAAADVERATQRQVHTVAADVASRNQVDAMVEEVVTRLAVWISSSIRGHSGRGRKGSAGDRQ